jgi:hypothetical protein
VSLRQFAARLATTPLPWQLARALSWLLTANAVVTGWDYLHTPASTPTARSLTMVERIATLHTWGIFFLIGGLLLALGLLARRHVLVWAGHLICSVLYVGFTAATVQAVIDYSRSPQSAAGSILRAVTTSAVLTVLHIFLCYVRGPVPRIGDEQ